MPNLVIFQNREKHFQFNFRTRYRLTVSHISIFQNRKKLVLYKSTIGIFLTYENNGV